MLNIKPLKRFGQNYLTDNNIVNKIIDEIAPKPEESIIEIGPGRGILTKKIFDLNPNLVSVEIDRRVKEELTAAIPGLRLINGDFLDLDLNRLRKDQKKLRIVGNIPYNLTSPILFKMIGSNKIIQDSVLMVQLEVAQRMTGKKGTKDYGILAVLLQYFADVKICFKVSPNVFYPKPKVFSAVVHIFFKDLDSGDEEKDLFVKIVKSSFGNRRKTLKNSLSNSIFSPINFFDSGIDLSLRAEQLEPGDFVKLTKFALNKIRHENILLNSSQ